MGVYTIATRHGPLSIAHFVYQLKLSVEIILSNNETVIKLV